MSNGELDLQNIWKATLGELEIVLSKAPFSTWFQGSILESVKDGVFTVGVPNFFYRDQLKIRYSDQLKRALKNASGIEPKEIKIKVASDENISRQSRSKNKVIHRAVDNSGEKSAENSTANPPVKIFDLINNYSFETFIVGANNRLAHAAAMAVAENPGKAYNPLYIYGPSGLGKTHLLRAIGSQITANDPKKVVIYISSEEFANDFIGSIRTDSTGPFRKRYRGADTLIIDDIQFIGGKESTQEEIFHTFNHLHQNNKQLVLASDRVPRAIKGLEDRLATRFEWGVMADISLPDFETRTAILQEKAKEKHIKIPAEVIDTLARRIKSSVRELEGALNKLIADSELSKQPISESMVESVLKLSTNLESSKSKKPANIIKAVCDFYQVKLDDLMGKKRGRDIIKPRQMCMYLLRAEGNLSYPDIGREMGGRDHTTILYGFECIDKNIATNNEIKTELNMIKEKLRRN